MTAFDQQYMSARNRLAWRAPFIVHSIVTVLKPKVIVDVGCATGDLVKSFLDFGVDAYGIDLHVCEDDLLFPENRFFRLDLAERFDLICAPCHDTSALALCVEVLPLLPLDRVPLAIRNLKVLAPNILIGCAVDRTNWEVKVALEDDFHRVIEAERQIRKMLDPLKDRLAVKAFYNGLQVWRRKR